MSHSEADLPTDSTICSSPREMQPPACDCPLGKDQEVPEEGWLLDLETQQPHCAPENSNLDGVSWKLPSVGPLSFVGRTESSCPEMQPQGCGTSPQGPWNPSKKLCENQGNLLQFDRQAPGRISTSPTLRRLRGSSLGSSISPPHQDVLDVSTQTSWRNPTSSPGHLSKSLPGSPRDSSPSLSPLRPRSGLLSDPESTLSTADSFKSQTRTPDEHVLLAFRPINEGSPHWASLPGQEGHSTPNPTAGSPRPQGEELQQSRFYERRRSSVVLNLPGLEVFPGDLLVSDGAADYLCHPLLLLNPESKKTRWPFSKRGVNKDKHKLVAELENCLSSVKITDFRGYEFRRFKPQGEAVVCSLRSHCQQGHGGPAGFLPHCKESRRQAGQPRGGGMCCSLFSPHVQDKTWNEVMETRQKLPPDGSDLGKQQEAVWELFTSECTYFLDHLLVLKMIFLNTLKYLQIHEYLLDVDLWRLFANLEELTQTSLGFVNSLFSIIKVYVEASETSPLMDFLSVLAKYFRGSLCQSHQTYCLNYSAAVFYLESLRQRDDFSIYLKWCEQNEQCRRLHLPELLVAPLHRLTRYPLLLKNIWKRSSDSTEKIMIYSIKEKVEKSIRDLEGKVKWLDNFQKFRHLQEIIIWPPLWDRDKRFFIPECLKHIFKDHTAEHILSPTNRHLLYEGKLTLAESTRFLDVYLFLFDDFLLITKTKRSKKKLGSADTGLICPSLTPELQTVIKEGGSCIVLDQPIPLDRLVVKSIDPLHVSVFGLRNAFLIQHENRYRQCVAAFLLQAQTEDIKKTWMTQITAAISCFTKSQETKKIALIKLSAESSEI
ncbi:pleckstrin homology domain-containing family G member 7 isoform X2 [Marmota marmota marmota]|uniref:pleckstrin homology domain-containing family G member 7 isoform X2 n=1 Tax=Marmota marmota marmota TaxID=9994 RepID=UPI0020938E6F|nr:pleckstrin homology domain-containing family G member 7 isoform X2 [Marmota marmota marmota]